tara:strand:+ start:414 stop:1019 length:606 start_codon:yes stop_codon:yes gene_type:complete
MNININQALFAFANEMVKVKKNQKHGAFNGSFYTDINEILNTIKPVLERLDLVIVQTPQINELGSYLNTKIFLCEDPTQFVESNIKLVVNPNSPRVMWDLGGAITYTRRYAITCMLGLESVDDDFVQGTKDAQNTPKPAIIKTNAKQRNEPIVKMMEDLVRAKADGDFDTATDIMDEATEKNLVQVQSKYIDLFESKEATI